MSASSPRSPTSSSAKPSPASSCRSTSTWSSNSKQLGLWSEEMRTRIKLSEGIDPERSPRFPKSLKAHLPHRLGGSHAFADRYGRRPRNAYIDQSQSLNLFAESPNIGRLSSMYMYAWKRGIKTTYYLRSRPATKISKTTVAAVGSRQRPVADAARPGTPLPQIHRSRSHRLLPRKPRAPAKPASKSGGTSRNPWLRRSTASRVQKRENYSIRCNKAQIGLQLRALITGSCPQGRTR